MLSKSLFKQSCKANGTMLIIITIALFFMLSCVMLISGRGDISETKDAIQDTIIEGELKSALQEKAISYYEIGNGAMEHFDETFLAEYQTVYMNALTGGMPEEQAAQSASMAAYSAAATDLQEVYVPELISELENYGIKANRKTIYDDIELLRMIDVDIIGVQEGQSYY